MAVQFCTDCGNLLPISFNREVKCDCCGVTNTNNLQTYVSTASTSNFPSELRDKKGPVQAPRPMSATDTWSKVDMQCPQCHANDVRYTAVQLRSADEGTTMFYSCSGCSNRWNENN